MSQPRLHLTVHSPFPYYGWHFVKEMVVWNWWPFGLHKNMNLEKSFCSSSISSSKIPQISAGIKSFKNHQLTKFS